MATLDPRRKPFWVWITPRFVVVPPTLMTMASSHAMRPGDIHPAAQGAHVVGRTCLAASADPQP